MSASESKPEAAPGEVRGYDPDFWLKAIDRAHAERLADFYARHPWKRVPADHKRMMEAAR